MAKKKGKKKMPPALVRAQARYCQRNEDEGLRRINLWIPEDCRDEIIEIAAEMRDEHRMKFMTKGAIPVKPIDG